MNLLSSQISRDDRHTQVRKDLIKKFRYVIAYLWILDLNFIRYNNNLYYVICTFFLEMTFRFFFITGLFRN